MENFLEQTLVSFLDTKFDMTYQLYSNYCMYTNCVETTVCMYMQLLVQSFPAISVAFLN